MRALVVPSLVLLLALAGCLGTFEGGANETDPDVQRFDDNETDAPPAGNETPPDDEPPEKEPPGEREQPPRNTTPQPRREVPEREWPPLGEARVRPGVRIDLPGGGHCTSNFIFTSPDNATVYIGTAAHCVAQGEATNTDGCSDANEPLPLGAELQVSGATKPGVLVYSSWETMQRIGETNDNACRFNDFALLALHPDDYDAVHPAMLHFGGPTALASPGEIDLLDKLLSYGNSGNRFGIEPSNWHEGYVVDSTPWTITAYIVTPVIPGDSGSAVVTADGKAAGVAVTVALTPLAASNGITVLDTALGYAVENAGVQVQLATWEQLDPGFLP